MRKILLTIVLIVSAIALLFVMIFKKSKNNEVEAGVFQYGLYTFQYSDQGPKDAVARLSDKVITKERLSSLSIDENLVQQAQLILAAISRSKDLPNQSPVILNLKQPSQYKELENQFGGMKIIFKPEPGEEHLAVVDNQKVLRNQMVLDHVLLSSLETQAFFNQLDFLHELMTQHLILSEAEKNKMNYDEFVKTYVTKGDIDVSEREIFNFMTESNLSHKKSDKNLKIKIASILKDQKTKEKISDYIITNYKNTSIEYYFSPPQHTFSITEAVGLMQKDQNDKRKTVYIFSNLNCGPCRIFLKDLIQLYDKNSQNIQFLFVNSFHDNDWVAQMMAEASICLGYQNEKNLWGFMKLTLDAPTQLDEKNINDIARATGADYKRYQQCMLNREATAKVQKHLNVSRSLPISAEPTVIADTMVFTPSIKFEHVKSAIDHLSAK